MKGIFTFSEQYLIYSVIFFVSFFLHHKESFAQSPGGVTGAKLWLKADAGTNSTTEGVPISTWNDQSGNGNNVTQATGAAQPLYKTSFAELGNFNPLIKFSGAQRLADANGILGALTYSYANAFVISRTDAVTSSMAFNENVGTGTHLGMYTPWNDNVLYWDGANNSRIQLAWGGTIGVPYLWTGFNGNSTETNKRQIRRDGLQLVANTSPVVNYIGNNSPMTIGAELSNGTNPYNGAIGEVIIYTTSLTATERQKIESYLAIKYGKTVDQSTATDYIASDASVIWNASANSTFKSNVAGIGRDDASGLLQKQSSSVNSLNEVVIGMGSIASNNPSNTSTSLVDKSFMFWGDNGLSNATSVSITNNAPGGLPNTRMNKVWKVQETISGLAVGNVQVAIPVAQLVQGGYLVTSTDATFASGNTFTVLSLISINGINYYAATVDLANNSFFTFSTQSVSPGGVTGAKMWVKADAGFNYNTTIGGTGWGDASGNGNYAVVASGEPGDALNTQGALMNFNPAVKFDGDDRYKFNTSVSDDYTLFGVSQFYGTKSRVFSSEGGNKLFGLHGGYMDKLYIEGWLSNPSYAADNNTYLYSLTRASGGSSAYNIYHDGSSVSSGTSGNNSAWIPALGGFPGEMSQVYIPEFIGYDVALNTTQKQRVESYLAIKYGSQLNDYVSATQYTPANYYASDGTILWSTATNTVANIPYNNSVTVIGRDDASGLIQKQSKSSTPAGLVTMALGNNVETTNELNLNTFGSDKNFEAFGDNGGSIATWTSLNSPNSGTRQILARRWRVQETGGIGSVRIQVPDNSSSLLHKLPMDITTIYLLVDADGDFSSGATETAMTLNGTNWEADVDFTTGQYFTFATESITTAPGGITSSGLINGVYYELYSGYDATPEDGITGTLKQFGYINDFQYIDANFLNEISDNFSLITKSKLLITTAGNYTFQANATDDEGAIFIDGILRAYGQGGNITTAAITLSSGYHDVEFRFSEGGGNQNGRLFYSGPDQVSLNDIPSSRLFVNGIKASAWYKADQGPSPSSEGASVISWADAGVNTNNLITAGGTTRTYYGNTATELLNYNPVVKSVDGIIQGADDANGLAYKLQGRTMFVVSRSGSSGDVGQLCGYGRDNNTGNGNRSCYIYNNGVTDSRFGGFGDDLTQTPSMFNFTLPFNTGNSYNRLATATYSIDAANNAKFFNDGNQIAIATKTWAIQANDNADLAVMGFPDQTGTGNTFTGNMGEVIIFPWTLSMLEKNKVESYLASKYGLTLSQNYTASDGSTIYWNLATNGIYNKNVTIIGRDDNTKLNQKQSKSAIANGLVAMSLGTSFAPSNDGNANVFSSDKSFEAIADDGGNLNWTGTTPPTGYATLGKTWRVQETGTVGTIRLQAADDNSGALQILPTEQTIVYLLKNNTANFIAATPVAMTLVGDNWEINTDFADGDYFTFATESIIPSPGGVSANNILWLKADKGISLNGSNVKGWADQSSRYWHASQTVAANQPIYNTTTNLLNFNPSISLNQANSQYLINTNLLSANITSNTLDGYYVGNVTGGITNYSAGLSLANSGTADAGNNYNTVLFIRANGVNNFVSYRNSQYGNATGLTAGATYLSEAGYNGVNQYIQNTNAKNQATTAYTNTAFNINRYTVGCRLNSTPTEFITGNVSEIVLYDAANTSGNAKQRIRSYLAIKYGQTLDQTTPYDYLASDGAVIWNGTTNNTYKNNITVIGRDDVSGLNQKQSKSQNNVLSTTIGLVTMGLGSVETSNAINVNNFIANKNFESFGDNGLGILGWTGSLPPTGRRTLPRVWKVQKTGTVGDVLIQVPDDGSAATVKLPTEVANVYLLISNNGTDFTTSTEIPMTLNGTNWEATVDFNSGDFFTFATFLQAAPGNVLANNVLWLKADAGVTSSGGTVSAWNDLSPRIWQSSQATVANQPIYNTITNLINFNPAITFDGSNDYLFSTNNLATSITSNAVDAYLVGNVTGGTTAYSAGFSVANSGTTDANVITNAVMFIRNNGTNNYVSYRNNAQHGNSISLTQSAIYLNEAGYNGANYVQSANAKSIATTPAFTNAFNVNKYSLGCRMSGGGGAANEFISGSIAEVIMYDVANTNATDRQKIRSYLAIKYGQTLDQTTPYNYLAADGTIIWDATTSNNPTFDNNITIIGRDDLSLLNQKQSLSQNNGISSTNGIVTISKGTAISTTNLNNNGSFTSDKSFIAFGDNGESTYYTAYTGGSATNTRMNRVWKVQRIGADIGNITMYLNDASATHLLIYSDAALTSLVSETALSSGTVNNVALTNGKYFTFAKKQTAPGGVLSSSGNINGLYYRTYDTYTANPALGLPGNLMQTGFVNSASVSGSEAFFSAEKDAYSVSLSGELQIVTAGTYTFTYTSIDDAAALLIDGVTVINTAVGGANASASISLSSGLHDIDARYSDGGGADNFVLRYSGPDNGNALGFIPDSKLFTTKAPLSLWFKADAGTSPSADNTAINTWADQSANKNDLTNIGGGTRTLYTSTAANMINFNPSVFFTNSEMRSVDNPNGLVIGRSGRNMFMVSTKTVSGSDHAIYHGNDGSAPGRFNFNSVAGTGGDNLVLSNSTSPLSTTPLFWTINGPARIATASYESPGITATNNATLYGDGVQLAQGTRASNDWTGTIVNDNGDFSIGTYVDGTTNSSGWDGMIPEVIYYPWNLTTIERQRVESYLAIKYGITLGNRTNTISYLASDGTTIPWAADATYFNDITVIGQDDLSGLNQKQSKSINTTSTVTVALGSAVVATNAANGNTFGVNKQFFAIADDSGTLDYTEYAGINVNTRISRVWKVKETGGDVGNVTIKTTDANATHLLVSTTANFSSGVTEYALNSQSYTLNLPTGVYFTFGRTTVAPAAVVNGLSFWLKADAGTNVNGANNFINGANAWIDQSPYARNIDFVSSDPQLVSPGINFNPKVVFDGDDYMRIDGTTGSKNTFYTGFTAGDMFSVIKSNSNNVQRGFPYYVGGPSSAFGHHYTWSDGNIYTGFGTNARKAWFPNSASPPILEGASATTQGPAINVLTYHIMNQHSATNDWRTSFDGRQQYQSTSSTVSFASNGNVHIGASPGNVFYGEVSEYIMYNRVLSSLEKQRLNSYLAIRYGITLDQTIATNYLASDGTTVVWNASTAGAYKNDITVIGRDDKGVINQKQSKSINASGLVTMALGTVVQTTNILNINTFSTDKSFESFGSNTDPLTWTNTLPPPGRQALERVWKLQEVGTIGSVRIQVPDDGSALATKLPTETAGAVYLFTDADGDFSSGATSTTMTLNGTNWECTVDLSNSLPYFTFGTNESNPIAGVLTNPQTCGGSPSVTLTVSGYGGKLQWQYSVDGSTWVDIGTVTTVSTLAVNPSITTFYRVLSVRNLTTVASNVVVVVVAASPITGSVVINDNITLGGTINITGDFTLNATKTITVPQGCPLVINATNIIINGTINGNGAGRTGGSGGTGGESSKATRAGYGSLPTPGGSGTGGEAASGSGAGVSGNSGTIGSQQGRNGSCYFDPNPFHLGEWCDSGNDGIADGGPGGGGGSGGNYGGVGGNGKAGGNGWDRQGSAPSPIGGSGGTAFGTTPGTPTGYDIDMGYGGAGAGAGGGANGTGSAGGTGGTGGGSISLVASNALTVSSGAAISANGTVGSNGGNGAGADQYDVFQCGLIFINDCWWTYTGTGGGGAGAGGGSGGGIYLQGYGVVNVTGALSVIGGNGGLGGSSGDGNAQKGSGGAGGGGGRIKIVVNPCQTNTLTPTQNKLGGIGSTGLAGGNSGAIGTYADNIVHPDYIPLVAGNMFSTDTTICNGGPVGTINADASTNGAYNAALSLPPFLYQWYVTKTLCASPTTGTGSGSSWSPVSGATNQNMSAADVATGIAAIGSLTSANTYCFQRRTQSGGTIPSTGGCYAWTTAVSVIVLPDVSNAIANFTLSNCTNGVLPFADLTATNPVVGVGSWSILSGPGTIVNSNSNNTQITDLSNSGGITKVIWKVANATIPSCPKSDTLTIIPLALDINSISLQSTNSPQYYTCISCSVKDNNTYTYYDNSGKIVATIQDLAGNSELGGTQVCIGYDYNANGSAPTITDVKTVNTNLGDQQPYLPRYWSIKPTANTDVIVTLYFTNEELQALQIKANGGRYQFSSYQLAITKYSLGSNGAFTAPASLGGVNVPCTFGIYNAGHQVSFSINSFSTFYIHPQFYPFAPLPVELISFIGWNQADINVLKWTTASEQNSKSFEVEKSINNSDWNYIGEKAGAGNSNSEITYFFNDVNPVIGDNYYRLKMIDNDGRFKYSSVINIPISQVYNNSFVAIYPNPTSAQLNIDIQSKGNYSTLLQVYDVVGKIVSEENITLTKGINKLKQNYTMLASGTYIITFTDIDGVIHKSKFVKANK